MGRSVASKKDWKWEQKWNNDIIAIYGQEIYANIFYSTGCPKETQKLLKSPIVNIWMP